MARTKKRLFSLIHGDNIHIAPNTKRIPESEFATVVDALGVLEAIKEDAELYRKEVISSCETIKEQAAKEGFEAGFTAWSEQLALLEQKMIDLAKEYENAIVQVAMKAAQKIVGAELQTREDTIVDIVSKSLKVVSQHKKVTIYVQRKEMAILEENRPRLKALFEDLQSLSIREREDVGEGGCFIETEGGIISAQLKNQWEILEQAFSGILKGSTSKGGH